MALNRPDASADLAPTDAELRLRRPATIDPGAVVVSYDARSDTLFLHFGGRGRPTVSIETVDDLFALVDPDDGELLGFQLEAFATRRLPAEPDLAIALDATELHGTTTDRIAALRRSLGRTTPAAPPKAVAIRHAVAERLLADAGLPPTAGQG